MRILYSICGIALALALGAGPAGAQVRNKNRIVDPSKSTAKQNQNRGPVPAEQLQMLLNMSPEEREKALSGLAPKRREQIERRIENLESRPPQVREQMLNLAIRLEKLPDDRQPVVREEIQGLRQMTVRERRERLHSEDFNRDYSPEEQQLIRDHFPNAARPR